MKQIPALTAALCLIVPLTACQSVYYSTMEKMGVHKRDIMVSRVQEARDSQQDAKEEFASALERFNSVLSVPSTPLQEKYDKLIKPRHMKRKWKC